MSLVAIDCETHLIRPGVLAPRIVCGSWAEDRFAEVFDREAWLNIVENYLKSDVVLAGANIAYDFGCILAARPDLLPLVWAAYEKGNVFDVQIAATLNAIHEGRLQDGELFRRDGSKNQKGRYSLDECVREALGRDDAKANDEWRLRYAELDGVPMSEWPAAALQYPKDDARNTYLVAEHQLANFKNLEDLVVQAHAAFCTHLGAMWGLRTDPKRVEEFKAEVTEKLTRLRAFGAESGLMRAKSKKKPDELSKDMAVIRERVFQAYGGLPPKTETGNTSTSREALEDSGDPVLEKFAEISKWEKYATYLPTLEEAARVPLNVKCNILLATGRASYDGLIQLLPRKGKIREAFVARPGTVWSSVDYNAIEMSTLAQVCLWALGHSRLAEVINAGNDVHSMFASHMLGMQYEDFLKRKKEPTLANYRRAAKAANFGFPGLMRAEKFVVAKKREGMSVCAWTHADGECGKTKVNEWKNKPLDAPLCLRCIEEAEKLREYYIGMWPEMRPYWAWVQAQIQGGESITQFVSKRVRGGVRASQAANSYFQGLAADGAKRAVIKLTKEMYLDRESALYGSRLLVFAHDETVLEIPAANKTLASNAARRQAALMIEGMKEVVPDVKVGAEAALMTRWLKAAEPVVDADGDLVPWEPKGEE